MKASHSEITTYLDCRVKHDFRYRKRLPVAEQPERLTQGIAVHAGLEHAAVHRVSDSGESWRTAAQQTAVSFYRQELAVPADQDMRAIAAATRAGADFIEQADIAQLLAVEEKFRISIDGWDVPGVIDLAYVDSFGQHHVLDWKTSDNLPQDTTGTLDPQTALYAYHWMLKHDLTCMYAGRCYVRLKAPEIEITKGGRVSVQSSVSKADYLAYVKEHPEHAGTAEEQEKAEAKFGPWWRHHEDAVTLDSCRAVLVDWRAVALEIEQNLRPLPNYRPKLCLRCEYLGPCIDRAMNGTENG